MKPEIAIIAALDQNRVIGKDNKIPWYISEDLKRFRALTIDHPVIMGRKTYESIGRPLPHRDNIVLSTRLKDLVGYQVAHTMEEAIAMARRFEHGDIFIIGGAQIYQQALPFSQRLYLTVIEGQFAGDAYFPDYSEFSKVIYAQQRESADYKYQFLTLER